MAFMSFAYWWMLGFSESRLIGILEFFGIHLPEIVVRSQMNERNVDNSLKEIDFVHIG